jgi:hypothetical protein
LVSFTSHEDTRPRCLLTRRSIDARLHREIEAILSSLPAADEARRETLLHLGELIHAHILQKCTFHALHLAANALDWDLNEGPLSTDRLEKFAQRLYPTLPAEVFNATCALLNAAIPLASAYGLNPFQLFADHHLNTILAGHPALARFQALLPEQREEAHQQVIALFDWGRFYGPPHKSHTHTG